MMTPVCRTNGQWTVKFRLAADPTKYPSQPYEIFVQREELWAERLHLRLLSGGIEAEGADEPLRPSWVAPTRSRSSPQQ